MKNLGNMIASIGILLLIYSVVGRFVDQTSIGFGLVKLSAGAGLAMSNSLMLVGLVIKSWGK